MIQQVRLRAVEQDATGTEVTRRVFAFGTHRLAASADYPALGANSMTIATPTGNYLRVIMDELLVGNYLEEIACRAPVDADAYDIVPIGTTPDDIAKCSVARDVLPSSCPGSMEHAVCICQIEGGCGETPQGAPVGVLDVNQDGAADDTRFVQGAVGLQCGTINVPIDSNNSYWNPSGDQNRPAMGGFEALGPALVITPQGPLPTNLRCKLAFAPDVVDKQNNQVCAPVGGNIDSTCTPGNVDAFEFQTQALSLIDPFISGNTGIDRTGATFISTNAPIAAGSLAAVTVTVNGAPYNNFTVTLPQPQTIRIDWTNGGLAANTTYTIRVAVTLTDTYGQPLVQPIMFTFTTGA